MPGPEQQHDKIEKSSKPEFFETVDDILNKLGKEADSLRVEAVDAGKKSLEQNLDLKEAFAKKVSMSKVADAFAKNKDSILSKKTDLTPDAIKIVNDDIKEKLENAENPEVLRSEIIKSLNKLPTDI